MINFSKIFGSVNSLPFLPRILFYSTVVGLVLLLFWSASNSAPRTNTALPPAPAPSTQIAISPLLFGTNLGLFNNNDQVLTSAPTRKLFQQIHIQAIRIPLRSGLSQETMLKAAQTIKDMGVVPVVVLPGPTDGNFLTNDVQIVSNMISVFGADTVYYEFGNEEDLTGISAERYTTSWNAVMPLLKKLAPQAQFAGPVMHHYDHFYLRTFLKAAQPHPDLVSWHEYACEAADSKDTCIAHIASWSTHIANARTTMTATIGAQLPVMISEWNYAPITSHDAKSNDTDFLSLWTQKALQTLVDNHVFASMQYFGTSSVPLVDSQNKLAVQGLVFQAMFTNIIKPTPTPISTATASPTATDSLTATP